jgi:hypothetical protein
VVALAIDDVAGTENAALVKKSALLNKGDDGAGVAALAAALPDTRGVDA